MHVPSELGPASLGTDPALAERVDGSMGVGAAVVDVQRIAGLPNGFFNAAAWPVNDEPDSPTLLLGRYVERRGEPGAPDIGSLALAVVQGGVAGRLNETWTPEAPERKGDLLEDVRAIVLPDGTIALGLTRLSPNTTGYDPFPAFATTTSAALLAGVFPDTYHIADLGHDLQAAWMPPGKNATPLGNNQFMFRPESGDHAFLAFSLDQNGVAGPQQRLAIAQEDIPAWGTRRMGSTMPPLWLNDNEALLLIHGISMVGDAYRYAIGSARLFLDGGGQFTIDNISADPHLTPESFAALFPGEQVELHPELRQAVYLCGGIAVRGSMQGTPTLIRAYPAVGDTRTVEATFSVAGITQDWDRAEPRRLSHLV